jgi:hypothetical protein
MENREDSKSSEIESLNQIIEFYRTKKNLETHENLSVLTTEVKKKIGVISTNHEHLGQCLIEME